MKRPKRKLDEHHQGAPALQTSEAPPTLDSIRRHAHEIYVAHGGAEGMALNDWLQAEQKLKIQDDNDHR